jgi:hypothetical protein
MMQEVSLAPTSGTSCFTLARTPLIKDIDNFEYSPFFPENQWKVNMIKDITDVQADLNVKNFSRRNTCAQARNCFSFLSSHLLQFFSGISCSAIKHWSNYMEIKEELQGSKKMERMTTSVMCSHT